MTPSQSEISFGLKLVHQPSDRPTPQRAGAVLEPHIIIEMTGTISDRRYIAYASSEAEISGQRAGVEIWKRTGPGGCISFGFQDLRIINRGTHSIQVSILEMNSATSGFDVCGDISTAPISVS